MMAVTHVPFGLLLAEFFISAINYEVDEGMMALAAIGSLVPDIDHPRSSIGWPLSVTGIPQYLERKLIESDPFVSLDQRAVGRLMEMAVTESRARKKGIKYGICGEHGGDPRSVRFCHDLGLDYVSCSPYRVPVARIAAAQANVGEQHSD